MYLLQLSLFVLINWEYGSEHSSSTPGAVFTEQFTEGTEGGGVLSFRSVELLCSLERRGLPPPPVAVLKAP